MHVTIKTLQRTFVTDPDGWLGQSSYFDILFSGKWGDKQDDGSYFIEIDADIFQHILRYLRTGVLPVFYDRVTGHDFALYQSLLEEAKYFVIDRLEKWLCEQKYLEAVRIKYVTKETQDRSSFQKQTTSWPNGHTSMLEDSFVEITTRSNVETTIIPMTVQRSKFYCPDAKHGHSDESYCRSCVGRATERGMPGVGGGWRAEDDLIWCIVQKEVVFDHDLCVNAYRHEE